MIRIAVCDDNNFFVEELSEIIRKYVCEYTDDFKLMSFNDGASMLAEHKHDPINIVFLDIDMPGTTGFDVAKSLRDKYSNSYIIFVTSHSELVYESMDFQPFNFIRKNCGISLEISIKEVIRKLMKHMKQTEVIILEDKNGRYPIHIHDIVYLESDKHYINFYIANWKLPINVRGKISEYEEKFSSCDFVRIHKKYLINLRYLLRVDTRNDEVLLGNINRKLVMSRNYKKIVDEKYTLYLRSTV